MYIHEKTGSVRFSATDLANHLACSHLTSLNLKAAKKEIVRPHRKDVFLETLRERGLEFEKKYLETLELEGKTVVRIDQKDPDAEKKTHDAIRNGADVIYQARLVGADFEGWADFVIKQTTETGHTYEVTDTKLANETRAGSVLQLCLYSEIIGEITGHQPEFMRIRKPEAEEVYRIEDYLHYTRFVKDQIKAAILHPNETSPEPVTHCDICNWFKVCNEERRKADHLGFVAGMGTSQTREFKEHTVGTMQQLAENPIGEDFRPHRGNRRTYQKLQKQAELQVQKREQGGLPIHYIANTEPGKGFELIPEPNKEDIHLDFEGDPLVEPHGREYLLGYLHKNQYTALWGITEQEEKAAFETFIDVAVRLSAHHPGFHIYHFGAYEESALKRLASRHATRQDELDDLLRAGKFVDLHLVVRQSIQLGVERYSLKDLEQYHGFVREADLQSLAPFKSGLEKLIQDGRGAEAPDDMKEFVRQYNEDDCRSTKALQVWLETIRPADAGRNPNPVPQDPDEEDQANADAIRNAFQTICRDLPEDPATWTPAHRARHILGHFLDWYRTEKKTFWWEFFRLNQLTDDELLEESKAIAGLVHTGQEETEAGTLDVYSFPEQDHDLRAGQNLRSQEFNSIGKIVQIDNHHGVIKIKKAGRYEDYHPTAIMPFDFVSDKIKQAAIMRMVDWINGQAGDGMLDDSLEYRSGRDLLLRNLPSFRPNALTGVTAPTMTDLALALDHGVLPVQGPPGSGKSTNAAVMIVELVRNKKKVGITALSHKVITELLNKVHSTAAEMGVNVRICQRVTKKEEGIQWKQVTQAGKEADALKEADIMGGTPFMWCRNELQGTVDTLVIDEAGQLSLIDTVACSGAGKNLILLGDPQQLQQPQQGSHPVGTEVSAMDHLLNGRKTFTQEQGLFLGKTYRMEPGICRFVSDMFYEGRLHPVDGLEQQRITGDTPFAGQGLVYVPVNHSGNSNSSEEEKNMIIRIVENLTHGTANYTDRQGGTHPLTAGNIKIIAPFNAQVEAIKEALPQVATGTVDKFQGQQAEVIIFSVTSSSAEDAPRGMEFLYAPHRLNVAVSRAKALFILVGSPDIFEPACKTPGQIKLANPWCRFRKDARLVEF